MSKHITPLRPGMTALAAVFALSSTALMAQSTDGAATQDAPVIAAPSVEAPAVAQTVAPEVPAVSIPAEPAAAPAPAIRTIGTPVVHVADIQAAPADRPAARQASNPVSRSVAYPKATASTGSTVDVQPVAVDPAPAPAVIAVAPRAAVPAKITRSTAVERNSNDDVAPIVGLAGLGALAVTGLAFAFRRKRRNEDQDLAYDDVSEPREQTVFEPAPLVAAPVRRSSGARTTASALPAGFDLSRFGPHVQEAYRGPTVDNPFLSLRRRLSRARFYDQREREALTANTAPRPVREQPIAALEAAKVEDNGQITVRLAPQRRTTNFGYAFQR